MHNTVYGVKRFSTSSGVFFPELPSDPWYVVMMKAIGIVLLGLFVLFAAFFYYLFPVQLLWLIPSLVALLFIILQ